MKLTSVNGSDARGSFGSVTVSRNRGGLYQKIKSAPTNPNTTKQQNIRNTVAYLSGIWRTLTTSQAAQWRVYAQGQTPINSLGTVITLSGFNAFMGYNMELYYGFGPTAVVLVPPPAGPNNSAPQINQCSLTASTNILFIALQGYLTVISGDVVLGYVTKPTSANRTVQRTKLTLYNAEHLSSWTVSGPNLIRSINLNPLTGWSSNTPFMLRLSIYQSGRKSSDAIFIGTVT